MSNRNLAAALLGLGLLTACGDNGTEPPDGIRYFPLTVGDTWTYAPADPIFGDPIEWRVTERAGDTVTIARSMGASHSGPVRLLDHLEEIDLLLDLGGQGPFYRFTMRSSWTHRDPWECDDMSEWTVVEEPDPITTPAGTFFHTVRIERQSAANCTDAGTMMEWWAPDVGLVRWEELNFYAGGPLAYELVSYSVDR
jgi:hypothetical protein